HRTPPTVISTLSLHDALPICSRRVALRPVPAAVTRRGLQLRRAESWLKREGYEYANNLREGSPRGARPQRLHQLQARPGRGHPRSEEHTSELQSRSDLVCRLL